MPSSSSSEIPAIAPGTGEPENGVRENTDEDEDDEDGAADDIDGVETPDVEVDKEGEDCRCDALRGGGVVRRARFLGGDPVNRVRAAVAISRPSLSHAVASARAARSAALDDRDEEDDAE